MGNNELRRIIFRYNILITKMMLTNHQVKLIKYVIKSQITTSKEVSKKIKISVQNASGQLNALYKKGYLERYEQDSETGGTEYLYKFAL